MTFLIFCMIITISLINFFNVNAMELSKLLNPEPIKLDAEKINNFHAHDMQTGVKRENDLPLDLISAKNKN